MIITNINTWEYNDSLESLLFFAQRMLELAYNKSDFKEKGLVVDAGDVIQDLLDLIDLRKISKEDVYRAEIEILLDELKGRIYCDEVIKFLLGDKIDIYVSKLTAGSDKEVLINTLQVLKHKLNPSDYRAASVKLIKDLIYLNKEKRRLYQATTRFFEFLIWYGYQKGTVYYFTNKIFFDKSGDRRIASVDDIDDFFSLFDLKQNEFEVVFVASKIFSEIEGSCKSLGLSVVYEREPKYNVAIESAFFKNRNRKKVFLVCEKIKAVDYQHAMKVAEKRVSLVSDLFVVFYHKHKPWHSAYCLVYKHDKENVVNISRSNNIMSNISENDIDYAKTIFPEFLRRFRLEKDSFNRFNRGVELHSLSLETYEVASQILNLWICLETLLISRRGKTHISVVVESVDLIAQKYATSAKIENLLAQIKSWKTDFKELISNDLPASLAELNEKDLLSALVCVEEYKGHARTLLSKMDYQPLLRFKFMLAVESLQSRKDVQHLLCKEKLVCERDIRRIYRSRNKIVHQGNLDDHNEYIAEMAHYYLDIVLFSII